jgi:hypothetical protein
MPRTKEIEGFLHAVGWGDADKAPMAGDASTRRYVRLRHGPNTAILMDQPQGSESAVCPPAATPEERARLGYNAVARLAGANTQQFVAIAEELRARSLSAPKILAHDFDRGFVLLEDLGDARFADIIAQGAPERPLYEAAIDVLAHLHRAPAPVLMTGSAGREAHLLEYDAPAMLAEVALLTDWFVPAASGAPCPEAAAQEYQALWVEALRRLSGDDPVLTLRDYHAENLMWLPDRSGPARVGLLDFQDALAGLPAYDLISLLEDARRDVTPELASAMMDRYVAIRRNEGRPFDERAFRQDAAILAAQRNAKIIGIFARLWRRDGKPKYLGYLPRMWGYMERDLVHPAMADLRAWMGRIVPQRLRGAIAAG